MGFTGVTLSRPHFWHRIRFKLLLVSLTLLGIPWAGYRFIQETEQFLREAQDQALRTTASSVANIMHGEPGLFHGVARPGSVLTFRNLYLHPLDKAPQVDGYRDDWTRYSRNFTNLVAPDERLKLKLFLGQHARYLYLLIGVEDATPTMGPAGDSVEIAVTDADGVLQRYQIQPDAPGWIAAKRHLSGEELPLGNPFEQAIRGEWQPHRTGYTVELRFPRSLIQDRLSIRVRDSSTQQLLSSAHMFPADSLGRIVERSADLQRLLGTVTPPATRVWVTDHQGIVLARAGQLDSDAPLSADQPRMPWFIQRLILAVLPRDADAVADVVESQTQLFMAPVIDALSGRPGHLRRQPIRGDAVVVSAAVPVRTIEGVKGAVLVEQTTNAILSIQNLALQRLFGVTLLLFAITSLGLLAFASLLASRILRLRNSVESAVSQDGRIVGPMKVEHSLDEIGDLGRSFDSVLRRLNDYNNYLEAMAARLAHELRTPLAVVRTSLENAQQVSTEENSAYLNRALDGAHRLETILLSLREATGLEQSMRQSEPVDFDLAGLLRLQAAGLRALHPNIDLQLIGAETTLSMNGVPDLISQAVDKLVDNAVDFHRQGSTITIACQEVDDRVLLTVQNEGACLPEGVDIFQSMVSARQRHHGEPHLGLGLFLVKLITEFHGGKATATDLNAPLGVRFTLDLPTALSS